MNEENLQQQQGLAYEAEAGYAANARAEAEFQYGTSGQATTGNGNSIDSFTWNIIDRDVRPHLTEAEAFEWSRQQAVRSEVPSYFPPDNSRPETKKAVKKQTPERELPINWDEVDIRCKAIEATCKAFGTRQVDIQEFSDLLDQFYNYIKTGQKFTI